MAAERGRRPRWDHHTSTGKPKVRHPDVRAARAAGLSLARTHGIVVAVYRCPWCAGWHLGTGDPGHPPPPPAQLVWP